MIEYTTHSERQTARLAEAIAGELRPGDVLALIGPLGSGKTRFVRGLVRGLHLHEHVVSSPTFLICHEYRPDASGNGVAARSMTLAHVDAYRLKSEEDLETIGWDELLARDDLVLAVEWADRVEHALPDSVVRIEFEHAGRDTRHITIEDGTGRNRFTDLARSIARRATHQCPICSRAFEADASTFPFCSERCRLADLGAWMSGSRMISRPIEERDLDDAF